MKLKDVNHNHKVNVKFPANHLLSLRHLAVRHTLSPSESYNDLLSGVEAIIYFTM